MKKINILLTIVLMFIFLIPIKSQAATKVEGTCVYGNYAVTFKPDDSSYKFDGIRIAANGSIDTTRMPSTEFKNVFCSGKEITKDNCKCPSNVTIYKGKEYKGKKYKDMIVFGDTEFMKTYDEKYNIEKPNSYKLTSSNINNVKSTSTTDKNNNSNNDSNKNSSTSTATGSTTIGISNNWNNSSNSSNSGSNSSNSSSSNVKCDVPPLKTIIDNFSKTCSRNNTMGYEECKKKYVDEFNNEKNNIIKECHGVETCETQYQPRIENCLTDFNDAKVNTKNESDKFTQDVNSANKDYNNKNDSYELSDLYNGASLCSNETIALSVSVIGKVLDIIKIVVPIILIIMAIMDIVKSIISQDDSKMKKSTTTLVKRLISAVIVFFILAIIQFVCGLVNNNSLDKTCMGIISNPWQQINVSD